MAVSSICPQVLFMNAPVPNPSQCSFLSHPPARTRRALHATQYLTSLHLFLATFALALLCLLPSPAGAQTYTVLHSFGDGSVKNDGKYPVAGLIQGMDGNFYGTTPFSGSTIYVNGTGVAFKITSAGVVTILHLFGDGSVINDGWFPTGPVLQASDGSFYGMTNGGGSTALSDDFDGYGTVYKMTYNGAVTILHSFGDGSVVNDGWYPAGGFLEGMDGNLYGTTYGGGASVDNGAIFKITPNGLITVLHAFGDGSVPNDGAQPADGLVQGKDGDFYGTTFTGGVTGAGTVFKVTPVGLLTILHSFGDGSVLNDGYLPSCVLVQAADGNFYGTAGGGSADSGTVFKVTPAGTVTILHSFHDGSMTNDGVLPHAGLIQGMDGNFYGTTQFGGSTYGQGPFNGLGYGTIFRITPSGVVTVLHSFGDGSVANDGSVPLGGLTQGADGSFYGTTRDGGSTIAQSQFEGYGTVYKLTVGPDEMSFFSGLQMISIPYNYAGTSLDTLFGYSDVTLAVWSPTTKRYVVTPNAPADQIVPGRAYWVNIPQDLTLTSIGTPADTTKDFAIRLSKGMNMIGDPFLATVPLSGLKFSFFGRKLTFARASSRLLHVIDPTVWGYSQLTHSYYVTTSLVPGQGYWIQASRATTMTVPHP